MRAFIGPVAEFRPWPGALSDIDVRWAPIYNPPMPAERERRTLDAPPQQPVTKIAVKTPQPVEVDAVLINPYDFDDYLLAGCPMPCK
ncbi:hypothetical protein MBRA_32130 [Mycobacterium branderi]|uniref:Uncharacterized protein n=1 Tax=Mycobacterium branderi TaxID=43348 RepID=A0ABM7KP98_9MYCO|nr:hypothetical protein MBRA_32130 [Mycobacterium branderi]